MAPLKELMDETEAVDRRKCSPQQSSGQPKSIIRVRNEKNKTFGEDGGVGEL